MGHIITPENIRTVKFDTRSMSFDASERLRIADAHTLGDLKILGRDNTYLWETTATGTGSFNTSENSFQMSVTSGQYVIRRTRQVFQYYAGNCQTVEMTFDNFHQQAGVTKRVGYFSSNTSAPYNSDLDGCWLESNENEIYLKVYHNGTERLSVPRSEWNGTFKDYRYDWESFSVIQFDFLWLGGAVLRVFMKLDENFVLLHQFDYPGTREGAFMLYPHHSVRYEIRSTTGSGIMEQHCAKVSTEGQKEDAGISVGVSTGSTAISLASVGTTYPIIAVRKNPSYLNSVIKLVSLGALVSSNADILLVTMQINPTLSAPLTYNNSTGLYSQFALGNGVITVTSPGKIQYSRHIIQGTEFPSENIAQDFLNNIGQTIGGVSDQWVLCGTPCTATIATYADINFKEF